MHTGHRKRLRERFSKIGIDNIPEHEVLEFLLSLTIPRKNTNELAHRLIKKFGSFSAVLDAPKDALEKVDGIGDISSFFLSMLPEFFRYYSSNLTVNNNKQLTFQDVVNMMRSKFIGQTKECVVVLLMDAQKKLKHCREFSKGSFANVEINVAKLIETVKEYNSRYVVLAHNHPGGIALPSRQDLVSTAKTRETLLFFDFILVDHFIVAQNDVVSMANLHIKESGLKNYWE